MNNGTNSWTLTLEQYTPVLNLQGDAQVPIRATELKPKIDKFILANYGADQTAGWLMANDNKSIRALDYKLRIECSGCSKAESGNNQLPMFFAGNKTPLMSKGGTVELTFFSLNSSLLEHLRSVDWNPFFLVNNFGTRQDKGYGSFMPRQNGKSAIIDTKKVGQVIKLGDGLEYRWDSYFILDQIPNWSNVMSRIDNVYRCMRSGINLPETRNVPQLYFKSLMFAYAKEKGYYWDKRMIKEKFYPKIREDQWNGNDSTNVKARKSSEALAEGKNMNNGELILFKDYLGLSTEEAWMTPYAKKITKKSAQVARFKSPLLFKPVKCDDTWYVLLLHREIPEKYKTATFTVTGKDDENARERPYNHIYGRKIATENNVRLYPKFTMAGYLNYVFDRARKYESHFKNPNDKRAKKIIRDLNTLRENYRKNN